MLLVRKLFVLDYTWAKGSLITSVRQLRYRNRLNIWCYYNNRGDGILITLFEILGTVSLLYITCGEPLNAPVKL